MKKAIKIILLSVAILIALGAFLEPLLVEREAGTSAGAQAGSLVGTAVLGLLLFGLIAMLFAVIAKPAGEKGEREE